MTWLSSTEVSALLQASSPGATAYLVGAGGCGMSGLGHLLLDLGYQVVGSDLIENEAIRQLRARGAEIHNEHLTDHIRAARPFLVVHSSAIQPTNPELAAAQQVIAITHLPQIARQAATHFLVSKEGRQGRTVTQIRKLRGDERAEEFTRMMGGEGAVLEKKGKER